MGAKARSKSSMPLEEKLLDLADNLGWVLDFEKKNFRYMLASWQINTAILSRMENHIINGGDYSSIGIRKR